LISNLLLSVNRGEKFVSMGQVGFLLEKFLKVIISEINECRVYLDKTLLINQSLFNDFFY